jgi:hypothetical protein
MSFDATDEAEHDGIPVALFKKRAQIAAYDPLLLLGYKQKQVEQHLNERVIAACCVSLLIAPLLIASFLLFEHCDLVRNVLSVGRH